MIIIEEEEGKRMTGAKGMIMRVYVEVSVAMRQLLDLRHLL